MYEDPVIMMLITVFVVMGTIFVGIMFSMYIQEKTMKLYLKNKTFTDLFKKK